MESDSETLLHPSPHPPRPVTMIAMSRPERHPLITGTIVTSLGTLASRILGLLRDMATAWLLGLGGVADAFWFAFRIPNLFRQLFGEGAMTASSMPVLAEHLEKSPEAARQLASVIVTLLAVFLTILVLLGELLLGVIWLTWGNSASLQLLIGLTAVMLPYLLLICVAAQLTTLLHAVRHFSVPALVPVVLNIVWLAAAWGIAPRFAGNQATQAYVLAVAVLVAGIVQVVVQVPMLRRLGFHFDFNWAAAQSGIGQILHNIAPTLLGVAVTQINTFCDTLIAWGLASSPGGPESIPWLGNTVHYPMREGAVAAIAFGDRFSELPFALVGASVAVAIFPLLSRHAARGDHQRLGADLTLGMRLVFCLAMPAGMGLFLLAEPISRLLFQYGQFRPEDTIRAARMVAYYAIGAWAYCESVVLVRGFYALGDFRTPARLAFWMVGLNLALNLTLIWPLAEAGLALSTSVTSAVQVIALLAILSCRLTTLNWSALTAATLRTIVATAVMAGVVCFALGHMPKTDALWDKLLCVGVPIFAGAAVYCSSYWLLGGRELGMLMGREIHNP